MTRTLEQLENDDWGEPPHDSHLVTTCHQLRRKPLEQFTTEDLRIMIGQNFSLQHLLPLAMDVLRKNPLASGDFYEGDLLKNVLECDAVVGGSSPYEDELATLCTRAMEGLANTATQEATVPLENTSADDLGLTEDAFDQLRQDKVREALQELQRDEAYKSMQQFLELQEQ